MAIKMHPEWTREYPAIDGIVKTMRPIGDYFLPAENAIRSDIEKILKMDDTNFNSWYNSHKETAEKLLKLYSHFAEIPDLRYAGEEQKLGMDANAYIDSPINCFKEGLNYLEKIKEVRNEYKK